MTDNKLVFISGLHKSGTSILHRIISTSEDVSGFENTGVPEDEGQHLQSVYKPALFYGGPGRFAFNEEARLDENSNLINEKNRFKLLEEWGRHWDMSKSVLIEKSPPNLIRMRFLQELFPDAYFITIIRNPIAVSYATQKWSKTTLENLLEHWLKAYGLYENDRPFLKREMLISYEELNDNSEKVFSYIENFIGIKINYKNQLQDKNYKYFEKWKKRYSWWKLISQYNKMKLINKYEKKVNHFNYSLIDFKKHPIIGGNVI